MNVFDLQAKISLDAKDYEKGLGEAKSKFSGFADGLKSAVGKVGDVLAGIGKAAAVGVGAASTALTELTKQSLDAVGSYEQLVGGVDTLFKDASQKVQEYANQAYMTAGLSANEYMETTIQFSASLIQGLKGDTQAAADIANTAITDMADNVNKMGTTMEAVQNTYRGLSRQNFTMLDNLALGYQGTAEEMARLINDSGVMGDAFEATADNVKEISFDKYIEAIHVIQEEMGITGTTSKEAAGTITGSVASMKAAFQNFLTGTGSAKQFTDVLSTAFGNVKNNLKDIIPRLTEGLTELVDLLAPEIPPIIEDTLPSIIQGSSTLLTGLAKRLPQLLTAILPSLAEGVVDVTTALVGVLPELITSLKKSIPIVVQTIMSKKDDLLQAGKDIIGAIFPQNMDLGAIVDEGTEVVNNLMNGLLSDDSINLMLEKAPIVLENIGEAIKTALFGSEQDGTSGILGAANNIIDRLTEYFDKPENRQKFYESAKQMLINLGNFLVDSVEVILPFIAKLAAALAKALVDMLNDAIVSLFNSDYKYGSVGQYSNVMKEAYLNADTNLSFDKWIEEGMPGLPEASNYNMPETQSTYYASEGMLGATGFDNAAAKEAYRKYKGYATGFYATQPTWLNNTLVGENGSEVLLPLDRNTEWMDKLADKLSGRMGGGDIYITVNAPTGNADDIVAALDEALRNRQIAQDRSTGGTGWK